MPNPSPPSAAVQVLPVIKTLRTTYRSVFVDHLGLLPTACLAPFLLTLVFFALSWWINFRDAAALIQAGEGVTEQGLASTLVNLALAILSVVPYVLFFLAWHRLVLLGPVEASPRFLPSWGRRHWLSLGYMILVILIVYGLIILLALPMTVIWAIVAQGAQSTQESSGVVVIGVLTLLMFMYIFAYLYVRWSFVFPAIAVDETFGLRDSWRLTRGQGWRLVLTGLLVLLPCVLFVLTIAVVAISLIFQATGTKGLSGVLGALGFISLFNLVFGYILLAPVITLVAVAFRAVTDRVPPTKAIADSFR